jgi:hypothetical protein
MANKIKERESFVFQNALSDIPFEVRSEEEISKALFKGSDPEKMIDAWEAAHGIPVKETPLPKLKVKNVMLSPGVDDEDADALNKLYNDHELYQIIEKSANWTPRGEYKIFVIYTENQDVLEARAKLKAQEEPEHE